MIHSTSSSYGSPRANGLPPAGSQPPTSRPTPAANQESLSTSQTESLRESLKSTPEIRPEVVAQGERLAVDPNYPPLQIIEGLAKMFVQSNDSADHS